MPGRTPRRFADGAESHTVEYVGEMHAVRDRHLEMRNACLVNLKRTLRRAVRQGGLPKGLSPRVRHLPARAEHARVSRPYFKPL